ncbi:KH domain-containing protein [Aciduricibacillus chroicocephali]|uniref:RNA-binding protein KhpA n=2 Tax=Aciduricibacillus chroicocephali TaxID=3054939 RepID=A0ABY9KYR9_9BACI|nr:KH domain-containing protein [Bacillaceae bacterium 44XB]
MKSLVESIVKPLAVYPDVVSIEMIETDGKLTCQLLVHREDAGKIIGRNGRIAKAIRKVMEASAPDMKVYLDIKKWEGTE